MKVKFKVLETAKSKIAVLDYVGRKPCNIKKKKSLDKGTLHLGLS